jgi:hypothetical protein
LPCDVSGGDVAIYTDTSGDVMYATDVQSSPPFLVNFWGRCTRRPPRFSGLSTNTINSIPFMTATLSHSNLQLTPTNSTLTGVEPILPRTYTISLTLTDDLITNSNPSHPLIVIIFLMREVNWMEYICKI